jgi:ribose 5-phosphate isomerase B
MRIGIAADHGGFELKVQLAAALRAAGNEVADFGAHEMVEGDDYPDFVVPLAKAVARGDVTRGLAICGSGVGACVAANKVPGARAALITDPFSAHQQGYCTWRPGGKRSPHCNSGRVHGLEAAKICGT